MLRINLITGGRLLELEHATGPLRLGRNPMRSPREAVHRIDDRYVSANQMILVPQADGRVTIENVSRNVPIIVSDGRKIDVGQTADVTVPVTLNVGRTQIVIDDEASQAAGQFALQTVAAPLGRGLSGSHIGTLDQLYRDRAQDTKSPGPTAEELAHWFETIVGIQRAAVSTGDFYRDTARAVVDLVGLDCGLVLIREPDGWSIAARHANEQGEGVSFSHSILRSVVEQRRTFFQTIAGDNSAESLRGISAVVAAPILDESGRQVVAAVYGSRVARLGSTEAAIRPIEAQVVQVLAAAVGAGMVRLKREAELARRRVQFEQFFSPVLAEALDRDPDMLEGREREITVLFSDIRGFSRLSEQLSPRETFRLIRSVMERLTRRVREHDGVLVDYMGDGLLAMWNAPADQPEHADQAVRAAIAMFEELPVLSDEWRSKLGEPLGLGIGINTGTALVGNTGSELKFKYAPLGHAVNLASRIEGATKQFGVPILIADSTRRRLGQTYLTRRLGQTRLSGMARPIDVFELYPFRDDPDWVARRDAYEEALSLFERKQCAEACQKLQPLLSAANGSYDLPSLTLMSRAINYLRTTPERFDPVFVLETK